MSKRSRTEKTLLTLVLIVLVAPVWLLASGLLLKTYRITTGAMEPTLPNGSHIVVRMVRQFARGDLVAFRFPNDQRVTYAKRAIAIGGDLVEIRAKKLFVNGVAVTEPYVQHEDPRVFPENPSFPEPYRSRDHFGPYRVEPGHIFMLGDNRDDSNDSRFWGTVPFDDVLGKVLFAFSLRRGIWRPK